MVLTGLELGYLFLALQLFGWWRNGHCEGWFVLVGAELRRKVKGDSEGQLCVQVINYRIQIYSND